MTKGYLTCVSRTERGGKGLRSERLSSDMTCRHLGAAVSSGGPSSWLQTRPLQSQGWERQTASASWRSHPEAGLCLRGSADHHISGKGALSFRRPQVYLSPAPEAWLSPGCGSTWPKGSHAAFAAAEMSGVAANTFIFSFHLPAKSFFLLLPLEA